MQASIFTLSLWILLCSNNFTYSQCFWAKKMGNGTDANGTIGYGIDVDQNGNVFTTGTFTGVTDFDPSGSIYNLNSSGNSDAYISKLDVNGNFVWAKKLGGTSSIEGKSLVLDNSGNIFIIGDFSGTADFDPGAGTFNLTSSVASGDVFICKLDMNGNFLWAKKIGGTRGESIKIDDNGNVIVVGNFAGTVDFDPGPGVYNMTSIYYTIYSSNPEVFIVKLDNNGNFIWAKNISCTGFDNVGSVTTDQNNNVLVTGFFRLTGDFDPGLGTYSMTAEDDDVFILKLTSNGDFVWAKQISSTNGNGADIATDNMGNVFTVGQFMNTVDFDPGAGVYNLTGNAGFISKLSPNGNFLGAAQLGVSAQSISIGSNDKLYISGLFLGTMDFDPGLGIYNMTSVSISLDLFVSMLDNELGFISAKQTTGSVVSPYSSGFQIYGSGTAIDANDNLHLTGTFGGITCPVDFDPGAGVFNMNASNGGDIYVYKLYTESGIAPVISSNGSTLLCQGESVTLTSSNVSGNIWSTGATTQSINISANGDYFVKTNSATCFPQVSNTITVTVNPLPAAAITPATTTEFCQGSSVILNANTAAGLSYQWMNNGNNISGAISSSYTATTSGPYTVMTTNSNGCSNTSLNQAVSVNPLPNINAGPDQIVCIGSTVILSATAGATYSWNNSVSNGVAFIPASTAIYTVTGTNTTTGCTNTDQVVVNVNDLPSVNAGLDQTACFGTSIVLAGTGANSYSWNNNVSNGVSFTPTVSGSYTVTGTDGFGCTNTDQVTVTVNPLPTVNAGLDQTLCQGQSATLFGSGANTYSWTNNISNGIGFLPTITQEYSVTGMNTTTGCSNTDQVIVTVNALPNVNAGTDQSICKGDAVTLSGTGANSYTWNNNITNGVAFNPIATATYSVSGTDANGCINADEVIVMVNEASASTLTESAMDSYTLNGQTYTQSGTYTQVIPNTVGCDSAITLNLTLSFTGITEIVNSNVLVYPNPTNDLLNIILPSEASVNYVLLDSRGRKVQEGSLNYTGNQISLKAFTPGAYFLKIGQNEVPIRVIKQ